MSDTTLKQDPKIQISLDLEKVSNGRVNAIGLFVGDEDGNTHHKEEWWIKVPEEDFDPRCKTDFWEKNEGPYKRALEATESESEQIKSFVKVYDSIHEKLGVEEKDIKLISDNAEIDYGNLSELVKKHCGREPLRYTKTIAKGCKEGTYRSITELDEVAWQLGVGETISNFSDKIQVHNHYPSNDAENTWVRNLIIKEFANRVKERYQAELKKIATEAGTYVVERISKKRKL